MVSFLVFVLHEAFETQDFILFILIIGVLYKGWKGAGTTSVNDSGLFLACAALLSGLVSTTSAAMRRAAG